MTMAGGALREVDKGGPRRLRRAVLAIALVATVIVGYLAGGFVRFAQDIATYSAPQRMEKADGIVVLTGGAARLDQAIDLLKDGLARRLLISGVNPRTSVSALSRLTSTDRSWFDCCVDIDYAALDTIGNAEITERWANRRGFRHLILVTSDYHMPRSLLEFDRLPDNFSITPYPVVRPDLWRFDSLPNSMGMRVLLVEYGKLLAARLRMAAGVEPSGNVSTRLAGIGR